MHREIHMIAGNLKVLDENLETIIFEDLNKDNISGNRIRNDKNFRKFAVKFNPRIIEQTLAKSP